MGDSTIAQVMKSLIISILLGSALAGYEVCQVSYMGAGCSGNIAGGSQITPDANKVCLENGGKYRMMTITTNGTTCTKGDQYTLDQYSDSKCETKTQSLSSGEIGDTCDAAWNSYFVCGKCSAANAPLKMTCTSSSSYANGKNGVGKCAAGGSSALLPSLSLIGIMTAFLALKN